MGVTVSSSHVVSAAPTSSGGGLLTLFPFSSVRSLSLETSLHKSHQCEPFPCAAALHELPQCGFPPWGAVLQEQADPAWVPHGVTASFGHPPAPAWGPFHGLQVEICSTVVELPPWAAGNSLPHHGLHHGLQGKTLCSSVWSTSPSSFFTDLGVCRVVSFTSSQSSLPLQFHCSFFLPRLNYVITEAIPPLLIGLALASGGSILELAGTGLPNVGEASHSFLQKTPL